MLEIKVWRNPYDTGVNMTTPRTIALEKGLTVLVGCNGAGKTTLLCNIEEQCKKQGIPVHLWDNLRSGGSNAFSSILAGYGEEGDDMSMGASLFSASEGEAIKMNIGRDSRLYKEFFETGYYKDRSYRFASIFSDKYKNEISSKQRVILLDAADSGLSVDSIVEVKEMFHAMLEDAEAMGLELYLVISANEYELARKENCFDVNKGKYITFKDYEDYRSFVLNSRAFKENRIQRERAYLAKQKEKAEAARQKRAEKYTPQIEAIEKKAMDENRELSWSEKYEIDNLKKIIERGEKC